MALETSRNASTVEIERVLEFCAQKIPTLEIGRVAFIGDITKVLWLCAQTHCGSGWSSRKMILLNFGYFFRSIRRMIGASTLDDCYFHLYTTAGANTTTELPSDILAESVQDVLAYLEHYVRLVLRSQNVMILLIQKDSGVSWVSKASSQCFRDAFGADLICSHHERHGMLVQEREPPPIALSQPPVISQPFWNSGTSKDRNPHVNAQVCPFLEVLEDQGRWYNTITNGGNKGLDTGPLAIVPSWHRSMPTNAMIQFVAHIEKYGKQRAAEAEKNLNNFPAPHPSSTSIAQHPNFPSEVLRRVAERGNPKIRIHGLDLSCAFVVCDLMQSDLSIIYASDACEKVTGYTRDEITGQNFLFMDFPDEQRNPGAQRPFFNSHTFKEVESQIAFRSEYRTYSIGYRKGGPPFMNFLTGIPIRWDGEEYRFYVNFMIDFFEHPDCVLAVKSGGVLVVNYSLTKTSKPVEESEHEGTSVYRRSPTTKPVYEVARKSLANAPRTQTSSSASDLGVIVAIVLVNHMLHRSTNPTYYPGHSTDQQASMPQSNAPAEQTALRSMTSPEADSPWSERDGLPPPYALSPEVFYHTSRMAMLSP